MRRRSAWSVLPPLAVCALLTGWVALSVASERAVSFSILVFAVANLIVYTDAVDFALRLYMRRRHTAAAGGFVASGQRGHTSINLESFLPIGSQRLVSTAPFAIIASVFNLEDEVRAELSARLPATDPEAPQAEGPQYAAALA